MKERIMVIFGGRSVEHDISIITGLQTLNNLSSKYEVLPVYIDENGVWQTGENFEATETFLNYKKARKVCRVTLNLGAPEVMLEKHGKFRSRLKVDCAVLCLHGRNGEDGTVQGLLELCKIPYTSCSVLSSAVCMDKAVTKKLLCYEHIATPKFMDFYAEDFENNKYKVLHEIESKLSFPLIVKPANLGSSVGISICEDMEMISSKIENALLYDEKVVVEEFVKSAKEYAVAVFKVNGKCLTSKVQEMNKSEIYTFEDKYLTKKEQKIEKIPVNIQNKLKKLAIKAYQTLECDGVVRVDFLSDTNGKLYVNELNTIPGSLAFNLFDEPFKDLLDCLILEAKSKMKEKEKDIYQFNSEALVAYSRLVKNSKYSK